MKILVIEDNATTRELIVRSLKHDNTVYEAEDGLIGVELALLHQPDLIICDISMPNLDGFGVLDRLREIPEAAAASFIFLTAFGDHKTMRQGMNMGADDFLTKPFTPSELRTAVAARVRKNAARESALQRTLEELRRNITMSLPHELRTAIMVIEGYTHLMLEDQDGNAAEHREMLELVGKYASRLHRLSEQFLWYVKTNLLTLQSTGSSETLQVKEVVEMLSLNYAGSMGRGKDLSLNLEPAQVAIEEEYLGKIILELLDNAMKFSNPETPISIEGRIRDRLYVLSVTDYGRGMSREQIDRIGGFIQFERDLQEQQGTGLGLIIARRLTEATGGKFNIHSLEDRGTVVTISLPHRDPASQSPQAVPQSNPHAVIN